MPGVDQLTARQKDCLRMVHSHATSKEIAITLGISKWTVDQRIAAAVRVLDARSRIDAARMLAASEATAIYDRVAYDPIDIAAQPQSVISVPATTVGGSNSTTDDGTNWDQSASTPIARDSPPPNLRSLLPLRHGGRDNDLGITLRLAWIVVIAITAMVGTGVFLAGLEALGRLLR